MSNDGWSPKELLARLSTKVPIYSAAPGGYPRFTMEDVAWALSGLPFGPYSLARVKYCFDERCLSHLRREVEMMVMTLAVKNKWRGSRDVFMVLAGVAVGQILSDRRCRSCKGTGYIEHRSCGRCQGVGLHVLQPRAAASLCRGAIKEDAWRKTWAGRYQEVMDVLMAWDTRIESHLYSRLYRTAA